MNFLLSKLNKNPEQIYQQKRKNTFKKLNVPRANNTWNLLLLNFASQDNEFLNSENKISDCEVKTNFILLQSKKYSAKKVIQQNMSPFIFPVGK